MFQTYSRAFSKVSLALLPTLQIAEASEFFSPWIPLWHKQQELEVFYMYQNGS